MMFYLGTDMPGWLWKVNVPLFISYRRLHPYKHIRQPLQTWALDSGGFTELSTYGNWTITPKEYAAFVQKCQDAGRLAWAAVQDWMCEPFILRKTGKTVKEHQELTIKSYLTLMTMTPNLPWLPVLQGYSLDDYFEHIEMYARAGIYLDTFPLVGLGSICRRQGMGEADAIIYRLSEAGLKLHGFGLKREGLRRSGRFLASADSMAWCYAAWRSAPILGHPHAHCTHCSEFALKWRDETIQSIGMSDYQARFI